MPELTPDDEPSAALEAHEERSDAFEPYSPGQLQRAENKELLTSSVVMVLLWIGLIVAGVSFMVTQASVVVIAPVIFGLFGVGLWFVLKTRSKHAEIQERKQEVTRRMIEAPERVGTLSVRAEEGAQGGLEIADGREGGELSVEE